MSELDELKAYFEKRFEKLENQIDEINRRFNERFERLEERLYGLEDQVRSIDYRVEDLKRGFKRYQKIQEIERIDEDEFLQKPVPALGGIPGEISPTGRYLRWVP